MDSKETFCSELHRKTKEIHDKSDKIVNLKLAIATTDLKLYGKVLFDFYHVYLAIENALEENRDHHCIAPILFRDLFRTEAFERDIAYYLGENWRTSASLSNEAKQYCDRVTEISSSNPELLVAYAHSMYLAILAGGQIISRILRRTLGLSDDEGLAIFQFEYCNKAKLKESFKSGINELQLDRETKDRIIAEKCRVFEMNNRIASNVKPNLHSFKRIGSFLLILIVLFVVFAALTVIYFQ